MKNAMRALAIATTVVAVSGVVVAPAHAANPLVSTAPVAAIGTVYYGNSNHCTGMFNYGDCEVDLWRIPNLLAGDKVTVAWSYPTATFGPWLCLTGNVDDYSWSTNLCNRSATPDGSPQAFASQSGVRTTLTVPQAAAPAFLTMAYYLNGRESGYHGAYEFRIETVRHRVVASLPHKAKIRARGSISVAPRLTNGALLRGATFTLRIVVGGKKYVRTATVASSGSAQFKLKLPARARGKLGKFVLFRAATATQQPVSSVVKIRVK